MHLTASAEHLCASRLVGAAQAPTQSSRRELCAGSSQAPDCPGSVCPGSQRRVLTENSALGAPPGRESAPSAEFSPRTLHWELHQAGHPLPLQSSHRELSTGSTSAHSAEFSPRTLRWELHQAGNPVSRDYRLPRLAQAAQAPAQSSRRELCTGSSTRPGIRSQRRFLTHRELCAGSTKPGIPNRGLQITQAGPGCPDC